MSGTTERPHRLAAQLAPRLARLIMTLRRETSAAGLSRVQLTVLATLQRGGPRRITGLAESEQITQPSMTSLISRMERSGWVRRVPDAQDRRAVRVAITDEGRRQYDVGLAAYTDALAERLRRLDPEQRQALHQAIGALDAVLDDNG